MNTRAIIPVLAAALAASWAQPARAQDAPAGQLGTMGAVKVPVAVGRDCRATLALYGKTGQVVRILGQVLDLRKGDYVVRWDGLDLFGHLVPAGTELDLKVITSPGVRAFYEMAVCPPADPPWGTGAVGEGLQMRSGGWLGDHSCPNSAVAVGERVLLGCFCAEHGSNMVAVTLAGEKLWGAKLDGWSGPSQFATDGRRVYALHRHRTMLHTVDPATGKHAKLCAAGEDKVRYLAADGERLYLVARNRLRDVSPFLCALNNRTIDFAQSRPQVLATRAPTEFHISPQAAFGNTFHSPGNPQNGCAMVVKGNSAFVLLVFKEPVPVGTVLLGQMPSVDEARVYVLKPNLTFDPRKHSPLRGSGDDAIDDVSVAEGDEHWDLVCKGPVDQPMNFLPAVKPDVKAAALYIRCTARKPSKDWRVGTAMARILARRIRRVPVEAKVVLPEHTAGSGPPVAAGRSAWSFRAAVPVGEVFPASVVVDFGRPKTFDGVAILNCVNPSVFIDAYAGQASADPARAGDESWRQIGHFRGQYNKRLRWLTSSRKASEHFIAAPERTTTRALRFRVLDGYRSGKWGRGGDDAFRVECDDVALVALAEELPRPPANVFRVLDARDGRCLREFRGDDELDIRAMACDPSGRLFAVVGNKLCRSACAADGLKHTVLNDAEIRDAISIAASADRVAVGDRQRHAVLVFDHAGKLQLVIGDRGQRKRGPWDPRVVGRPSAVAIDKTGGIWVAEEQFAPKRVARYAADGTFLREFLGPPMYGGGGCVDPNLKSFYYRSMEFELDWRTGTSRLKNLNDRLAAEESPALEDNSFVYTGICRPIYYRSRRYIVGGTVICLLDGPAWRPCVVMGSANHCPFLLGKELWKRHWARLDLVDKLFIWCDRNDDGAYQVEEVELFDPPGGNRRLFAGLTIGPDLTMWGDSLRVAPHAWTASGVPLFRFRDFQAFDYGKLAPHYSRNYTLGGAAKPHYNGFKRICADGSLIQEGQPFIVQPDLTILGGPPPTAPGDYVPPIQGAVLQTPWKFTGGAVTKSDIGEIAVVNSNSGPWHVWAARYGVVVDLFFTGADGGWGTGLPAKRGTEVTGRRQSWEGWGGDFIRASNGNYYAQAGKGFHAISRVEGLDEFKLRSVPVRVTAEQVAANAKLRPFLKSRYEAMLLAGSKSGRKEIQVAQLGKRTSSFALDGDIADWGKRTELISLGPAGKKLFLGIAYDEKGVYLAFGGDSRTGSACTDWKMLFLGGFGLDVMFRPDGRNRSGDPVAGDRRIVFGKCGGRWTAVQYDYVDPAAPAEAGLSFPSPMLDTRIARVAQLPKTAYSLAVRVDTLGVDVHDLTGADIGEFGEKPRPSVLDAGKDKARPKGTGVWSAEVFLPFSTLSAGAGAAVRCDFGILLPDETGTRVAERFYWSNSAPTCTGDPAIDAVITPGTWGYASFR